MTVQDTERITINYRRIDPETGKVNTMQDDAFLDILTRLLIAEGGAGSGKTYSICMKALLLSKLNRGTPGGCLVPNFSIFRRDVKPCFEEIALENKFPIKYNGIEHTYRFPWSRDPMWVMSADAEFPGVNLGWGIVNEHSLIPRDKLEEFLNRRVRLKCAYPQVQTGGTPEDKYGYLEDFTKVWTSKKDATGRPLCRLINGTTAMNAHNLRPGYIDEMRATLDPMAFKLWMEGQRVFLTTNAFYYSYNPKNNRPLQRRKGHTTHVMLDFNVGNMHTVFGHFVGNGMGKTAEFFDEIVLTDHAADTHAMGAAIKKWNGGGAEGLILTCDASGRDRKTTGPSDYEVLKSLGFVVRLRTTNPYIRKRQLRANGLMANQRLFVDKDKCPVLHKDLLRCEQDKMTFEKVRDSKGIYTHASDAMDYGLDFEFPDLDLDSRSKFRLGKIYD